MNAYRSGLAGVALGFGLVMAAATARAAETFDYTVERFEADGNVNGPLDGTPDLVDEFDDGVLAPWFIRIGAATESGGTLHVTSPGLPFALPGIYPVRFETSAAGLNGHLRVGEGNAVLRIVLPQQSILANDAVSFDLGTIEGGNALYYGGIVLTNFNSSLANAFSPAYPIGLAATAHLERISATNETLVRQHHPIATSAVTGSIVLELRYDDAARTVTPAVSVDGGATFEAVFDPVPVETDVPGEITVQVEAAALAGDCPATHMIRTSSFSGLGNGPDRQKFKMRLAFPSSLIMQGTRPVRMIVTDSGAGDTTLYDITLPDRATASQHACDPRDGWFGSGYVNKSNALPPACVPGSAQGLRRVAFRWNGTLDVRVQAVHTTLPHVTGPVRVTIYDGTEPINECDGWVADASCRVTARGARCP